MTRNDAHEMEPRLRNATCVLVGHAGQDGGRFWQDWRKPRPRHPQYTTPRAKVNGQVCGDMALPGRQQFVNPPRLLLQWRDSGALA
jgi:hypothetical protein